MRKIVIATRNKHKADEMRAIFSNYFDAEWITLDEAGFFEPIREDGETFAENAVIKAKTAANMTGMPAVADDSGLAVDVLGGEPGVRSARYAAADGNNSQDDANVRKLLMNIKSIPEADRTARFVCAAAYAEPEGKIFCEIGTCEGIITSERRGNDGFGYDPVFFLPSRGKTLGELSAKEKNAISHRARALEKLAAKLQGILSPRT